MVKKEGGVVRIEGGVVKKCKSVVKTLKTVVKINCIIVGMQLQQLGLDSDGRLLPTQPGSA